MPILMTSLSSSVVMVCRNSNNNYETTFQKMGVNCHYLEGHLQQTSASEDHYVIPDIESLAQAIHDVD